MKKCPISRANIVHFDTFALYQNVSYKMARKNEIDTNRAVVPPRQHTSALRMQPLLPNRAALEPHHPSTRTYLLLMPARFFSSHAPSMGKPIASQRLLVSRNRSGEGQPLK